MSGDEKQLCKGAEGPQGQCTRKQDKKKERKKERIYSERSNKGGEKEL